MRPALAIIVSSGILAWHPSNGCYPSPLKFKRVLHKSPVPLIVNKCYRAQAFQPQVELVAASANSSSREAGRSSIMGELGQEDNVLVNQLGIMEMGVVLPATQIHVEKAVKALRDGQVIAVPTDTLYGLAGDACSPAAVQRIYEIKGRSMTSPLAVCVADVSDVERFAVTSHLPDGLLNSLLPGPVTLVLERGEHSLLEKSLNPGVDSIGVRIPECDFTRKVARDFGSALALTSANQSGQLSTVCIQEFKQLWKHCTYIYDAGQLPAGREGSTIVDLVKPGIYKILRLGSASEETRGILKRFGFKETSQTGEGSSGV